MDKLLNFLDFSCIDTKLYWRIPSRSGQNLYEIQWQRDNTTRWRLRLIGEIFWVLATESTLVSILEAHDIDAEFFATKLRASLLQQVSYANRIVADARLLFGATQVDEALLEQEDFLRQLEQAVAQFTTKPAIAPPKLRVIKMTEKTVYN